MKKIIFGVFIVFFLIFMFIFYRFHSSKKDIVADNILLVGTNAEYPPFCFIEKGEITGFDIDVAKEVSKRLGKEIVIKDLSWDALVPELQMGTVQVVAAALTPTEEKGKMVHFTEPYLSGDPLVIVSFNDTPYNSLEALKGKSVIVNLGYTADAFMSKQPGIQLIKLTSPADAFMALKAKRADAFVSSEATVRPFFEQYGSETFHISPIEGTEETYSLAISLKYKNLFDPIQNTLESMKQDGSLEVLKKKWGFK